MLGYYFKVKLGSTSGVSSQWTVQFLNLRKIYWLKSSVLVEYQSTGTRFWREWVLGGDFLWFPRLNKRISREHHFFFLGYKFAFSKGLLIFDGFWRSCDVTALLAVQFDYAQVNIWKSTNSFSRKCLSIMELRILWRQAVVWVWFFLP